MKNIKPEESGKKILQIFKKHGVRPNNILTHEILSTEGDKMGLYGDELNAGMTWLFDNKYIYQKPEGSPSTYILSSLGFEKM